MDNLSMDNPSGDNQMDKPSVGQSVKKPSTTGKGGHCKFVDMSRYWFMRNYYTALRFLADCYFTVVDAVFALINAFEPIQKVGWKNASDLLFISALDAAEMIREGNLTSHELIAAYVDRLKEINPLLNAIAHPNFDNALKLAHEIDMKMINMNVAQRKALALTKPLYGVPFTSKDNLQVKGFVTGAGNQYLINGSSPATEDAAIVKRMKDSGAILVAITTMPNLGLSWAGDDTGYGITNNPHDTRRMTGGSSSGEGALISAGASLCGIGNDIGGSVRIPSNMNGIFGLKPTNFPDHALPLDGIVPASLRYKPAENMLTNGPMCRYATDLPLVLSIMAGKNVSSYQMEVDFAKDFKLFYLEDLHILISQELQTEQRNAVRKVKSHFEQKYNLTVQKVDNPLLSRMYELFYGDPWSPGIPSYNELKMMFHEIYTGVANAPFTQWEFELLKRFVVPKDDNEKDYVLAKKDKLRKQMADLLGKNGVLLTPVWPTNVPFHHQEPFTVFNLKYTMMVNILGFPALAAPTGKSATTGMPIGVQLIASPHNEALLIAVAKELERAYGGWVKPGARGQE